MQKLLFICTFFIVVTTSLFSQGRTEIDLSGKGWKLWYDKDASWQKDALFLAPVDIAKLPVNPPTAGWEVLNSNQPVDVEVPGTVEEYLQKTGGPKGDITGVSWWFRTITIPKSTSGNRILLRFESTRLRTELFINKKLIYYDLVESSPFEIDLTNELKPGETAQLALRITDPGGNLSRQDYAPFLWNNYKMPMSHSFGGITGRVKLISCSPTYISDIYIQNTPAITTVNALVTINNTTSKITNNNLRVVVKERKNPANEIFSTELSGIQLKPGENVIPVKISAPNAQLWNLETPNLYVCEVSVNNAKSTIDKEQKIFGFRWFDAANIGSDAVLKLNGKRIVLRTAICWGFYPINGMYITPEMAVRQVEVAKKMGLNMLNFHRCIGQPIQLEKADELGLLFFEEPGGYFSGDYSPFAHQLARQKLMRMVKRDRSHPSLVIYNMMNEFRIAAIDSTFKNHSDDIREAHKLDPTRIITRASAWAKELVNDPIKMHMRPNDTTLYLKGWFDFHHAGGPAVWNQSFYTNPTKYYNYTNNKEEIVYWGEEGAISSPPRLQLIKAKLDSLPNKGWDGQVYLDWFATFDKFIDAKKLRTVYPTVDALTTTMGAISLNHQGRKIETIRMNNVTDGYAINGWEAMLTDNHSGIVDCFRYPKADPSILAYYNQPLYIAVKVRNQIIEAPASSVITDFYIINEKDLKGTYTLKIVAKNPAGKEIFTSQEKVTIAGGEMYGQLIKEGLEIKLDNIAGMCHIEATLIDSNNEAKAKGREEVLLVDWEKNKLTGKGATWEYSNDIKNYLTKQKQFDVASYNDNLPKLDWIVVARSPKGSAYNVIPTQNFLTPTGKAGVSVSFFEGDNFKTKLYERIDPTVNLFVADGATPDQNVPLTSKYSVRYEGQFVPEITGTYSFELERSDKSVFTINGQPLPNERYEKSGIINGSINLEAGKPVTFKIEFFHLKSNTKCILSWSTPQINLPDISKLIDRVKNEGTTLILLNQAETWTEFIEKNTNSKKIQKFTIGTDWLGGLFFNKSHPIFNELPVNEGMDWPYQAIVRGGKERYVFSMQGEELIAGGYHSSPMKLGTALGIIPCGKGKIIFSTFDISSNLQSKNPAASVARKVLCNIIDYASTVK